MQSIRGTFDKAAAVLIVELIAFIALRKTGDIQPPAFAVTLGVCCHPRRRRSSFGHCLLAVLPLPSPAPDKENRHHSVYRVGCCSTRFNVLCLRTGASTLYPGGAVRIGDRVDCVRFELHSSA